VPFRRAPCIHALLRALATKGVEICGLADASAIDLVSVPTFVVGLRRMPNGSPELD